MGNFALLRGMGKEWICYNGKYFQQEDAIFPINRAMKYGDGLFETIRVTQGAPLMLSYHFDRLRSGLHFLHIECDQSKLREIEEQLKQLISKNNLQEGSLRLQLFRTGGGKYLPENNGLEYLLESSSFSSIQSKEKGLKVEISQEVCLFSKVQPNFKGKDSLPYIKASLEKKSLQVDDLILLNEKEELTEAISSNIFLLQGDSWFTPPLTSGCVPGVMRRFLLENAENFELKIAVRSLNVEDLLNAKEIFLSNSVSILNWVASFRNKRYFNTQSRKLKAELEKKLNNPLK
jgi:branched-chain amino acid aminotransferase